MTKWDTQKLESMTQMQNEFTKNRLNYVKIAEEYFEMVNKVRSNGDLVPLAFKDVEVAYNGKISDDLELVDINQAASDSIEEKENERQVMHIKHFSRSISHQAWFDYLDAEVNAFVEKYPEYGDMILE